MTDPTQPPVSIPEEMLGVTGLVDAALHIAAGGLRVVPMTTVPTARKPGESAGKNPGGLLGKGWQNKSTTDPDKLRDWFTDKSAATATGASLTAAADSDFYRDVPYESMVLGIHTGENLVVVDVDDWEHVPAEYRALLLDPAVPFQSSSATDPNRGHYLFTPRPGYRYGAGALPAGDSAQSPGEVRHGNSIIVSAPSVHQKKHLGRRYQWQRTGPAPVMPEKLAEWVGRNPASKGSSWQEATWNGNDLVFDAANGATIDNFMAQCTNAAYPQIVEEHVNYMCRLADTDSLHPAFLGPLVDLMKLSAFGFVNASEAAQAAMEAFVARRTDASRAALGGNVSSEQAATAEYMDLLQWAVGKTVAQWHLDPDALQFEAFDQVRQHYIPGLELPERPESVPDAPAETVPPRQVVASIFYEGDREPVRSTHAAVAAAMVKHLEGRVRFVLDQNVWYVYDPLIMLWKPGAEQTVQNIVAELLKTSVQPVTEMTFARAVHQAELNKDDREAARLTAMVVNTPGASMSDKYATNNDVWAESVAARDGITKVLKSEFELQCMSASFDNQPDRMAVGNGVLDLSPLAATPPQKPVLLEDGPEHLITFRSSTKYDPDARAPLWNKLIESAFDDPEVNGFLATWFGLCIDRTKNFGKFLLAYGKSHSGKGLIFGLGSSLVFGNPQQGHSLVAAVDKNLIVKTGMDMSGHRRRVVAELRGKAMAYIDESGDGGSIDTDQLKSYTGGLPQIGERKFENEISVDVPPLVVSSNHEWRLGDVDAGTSNRIISLYFAYGHGAGAPPDKPDDPLLPAKLAGEASGILNWALAGYMRWVHSGRMLTVPASVQRQTDTMNAAASEFGSFLDTLLEVTGNPSDKVLFKEIWEGWDSDHHGYKATNMSRSSAAMVSPRAVRMMRKSIEEHLANRAGVVVTGKSARVSAVHGVTLTPEGKQFVTGVAGWMSGLGT